MIDIRITFEVEKSPGGIPFFVDGILNPNGTVDIHVWQPCVNGCSHEKDKSCFPRPNGCPLDDKRAADLEDKYRARVTRAVQYTAEHLRRAGYAR